MAIEKFYYIEWKIPCKYEPIGFHEDTLDCERQEYYVTSYKEFVSEKIKSIKNKYKLKVYYSKTESQHLYLALNVHYRYHYITAVIYLKVGILKLNYKPDTNLIKLKFPDIYKDCRIVSRYQQV